MYVLYVHIARRRQAKREQQEQQQQHRAIMLDRGAIRYAESRRTPLNRLLFVNRSRVTTNAGSVPPARVAAVSAKLDHSCSTNIIGQKGFTPFLGSTSSINASFHVFAFRSRRLTPSPLFHFTFSQPFLLSKKTDPDIYYLRRRQSPTKGSRTTRRPVTPSRLFETAPSRASTVLQIPQLLPRL